MRRLLAFLLFGVVIVLAFITRFYKLGEAPAGFYLDEAAQGYNAYSILYTGKDEFGKSFPIVFRSFADFKTPVYIYLIVPLIKIFDLTPFTVRLPSFIFSMLTFPLLFLLLRKITPEKMAYPVAFLTTFFLAISPWHVLFGRTNFECNVALFFFLAGCYFFYKGFDKPFWFFVSALMFAVAIPSYHSQRITTPLLVLILFLRYRNVVFSSKFRAWIFAGLIMAFVALLPTLSIAGTPGFLSRATVLNIFSIERQQPAGYNEGYSGPLGWFVNGRLFLSVWEFASLYVSYFSPRYMFELGDYGPRSAFPELGTFFVWQFPFYIFGLYLLATRKKLGELRFLTLTLLFVAPVPAALTRDPYSTIRSLPLVIPQLVVVSLGALGFWEMIRDNLFKILSVLTLAVLIVYSVAKLYSSAIILNEHLRGFYWDYGWEEVVKVIKNRLDTNLPIVVDNARFEPYAQIVFFLKYPPDRYQQENYEVSADDYYTNMKRNRTKKIGNITIRSISWEEDLLIEQFLIGDRLAISDQQIKEHNLALVDEIRYPDLSVAYIIVKTNPE